MVFIEQAIFTSDLGSASEGYRVAAASPGVTSDNLDLLHAWGPGSESLVDPSPGGVSFNFFPLTEDQYCVSRTTNSGWESANSRPRRTYSQCLIVPQEIFERFANNPFQVLRAAMAAGKLEVYHELPRRLEPLELVGRSETVSGALLIKLCRGVGLEILTTFVNAALEKPVLVLTQSEQPAFLISGLFNCIPVECRPQFSFSTGLRFSAKRPFRLVAMPEALPENIEEVRAAGWPILPLIQSIYTKPPPLEGWGRFLYPVLKNRDFSYLSSQFSKHRFGLTEADLPALALQLLEEYETMLRSESSTETLELEELDYGSELPSGLLNRLRTAREERRISSKTATLSSDPTEKEEPSPPFPTATDSPATEETSMESQKRLERFEALLVQAMVGKKSALEEVKQIWGEIEQARPPSLLERTREEYIHHILFLWRLEAESNPNYYDSSTSNCLDLLSIFLNRLESSPEKISH